MPFIGHRCPTRSTGISYVVWYRNTPASWNEANTICMLCRYLFREYADKLYKNIKNTTRNGIPEARYSNNKSVIWCFNYFREKYHNRNDTYKLLLNLHQNVFPCIIYYAVENWNYASVLYFGNNNKLIWIY